GSTALQAMLQTAAKPRRIYHRVRRLRYRLFAQRSAPPIRPLSRALIRVARLNFHGAGARSRAPAAVDSFFRSTLLRSLWSVSVRRRARSDRSALLQVDPASFAVRAPSA